MGRALSGSIGITSKLPVDQRVALEQLLFFNVNQHRVRVGIQQSIETYGVPEIYEHEGGLRVRVGDIVLHLGVGPRLSLTPEVNTRVLIKLMHEIRSAARRTRGVDRIELVYKDSHAVRLHG